MKWGSRNTFNDNYCWLEKPKPTWKSFCRCHSLLGHYWKWNIDFIFIFIFIIFIILIITRHYKIPLKHLHKWNNLAYLYESSSSIGRPQRKPPWWTEGPHNHSRSKRRSFLHPIWWSWVRILRRSLWLRCPSSHGLQLAEEAFSVLLCLSIWVWFKLW